MTCGTSCFLVTTLARLKKGIHSILEKKKGCTRFEKLRAILVMEEYLNFVNTLIFGEMMLRHTKTQYDLPEENSVSHNLRIYVEVALKGRLV